MKKIQRVFKSAGNNEMQRFYNIDGFILDLGEGHTLPVYQNDHPMYDKFVPYLGVIANDCSARYLLDIGANVGDTTAALIRHTSANVVCVEPTKKFYELCKKMF